MRSLPILFFLISVYSCAFGQNVDYVKYNKGQLSFELPKHMKLKNMYEEPTPDSENFEVITGDAEVIIELHSLISSRFGCDEISDCYNAAINGTELNITYKTMSGNYFVISGFNKDNGNIVYWKRAVGEWYVSDLHIEYNPLKKNKIEPFIGRISKSFKSQ
jgi:hypothetical protein